MNQKLHNFILFSVLLLCAALYLPVLIRNIAIILFFLVAIIYRINKIKSKNKPLLQENNFNKYQIPLILLYLLYAIGLFYSSDTHSAAFDLQVKLPLLLLPFGFLCLDKGIFDKKDFSLISVVLTSGLIIQITYLFISAIIKGISSAEGILFYCTYTKLSPVITPSYIALYTCIALIVCYKTDFRTLIPVSKQSNVIIKLSVFLYVAFFLMCLQSRSGFISLLLIIGWIIVDLISKRRVKLAVITAVLSILSIVIITKTPFLNVRYQNAKTSLTTQIQKSSNTQMSSMEQRKIIYSNSYKLLSENPLLGTGTGDVKQDLTKLYNSLGFVNEKYLNCHNQFLQTAIALGILGLIVLLSCFAFPLLKIKRNKDWFILMILVISGLNFLFESMLERALGTYCFALIFSLSMHYIYSQKEQ